MPPFILTWGTIIFTAAILDYIERPSDGNLTDIWKTLIAFVLGVGISCASAWSWELGEKAWRKFKNRE